MKTCKVDDCERPVRVLLMCQAHYARWRRHGDPLKGGAMQAEKPKRYAMVKAEGHPLATKRGLLLKHRLILFNKIGSGAHHCHWCGAVVVWRSGPATGDILVVDHLDHDRQNNDPDNLVPSCNPCNGHRLHGETWAPWVPGTAMTPKRPTVCRKGLHQLTPDNTYERASGSKSCKTCRREWSRLYEARRRSNGATGCYDLAVGAGLNVVPAYREDGP